MANNYHQFSAILKLDNDEQKKWAEETLEKLSRTREDGGTVPLADPDDIPDLDRYESLADFEYEFEPEGEGHTLWFYAEESGNAEHVAQFVQQYLKKYHPDQCWGITWADTCSKMRVDEFSGGALFVTADKIDWIQASSWVHEQAKKAKKELR